MARYKIVDRSPRFLPIVLEAQLIPGSFEHALDILIDTEIDLSRFAKRFRNDDTGAPAYDPAVMLKIVLLAYNRGVVASRRIERLCRENVLFMAISGDSAPQCSTIAKFIRELGEEAGRIFTEVLLTCDRLGLIGRRMFAIDGVKLPSNADKRRSGTHGELRHEAEKTEKAVAKMVRAHRSRDEAKEDDPDAQREAARLHRMQAEAKRIREFLATHEERRSDKGSVRKSNVTDNDSAKMATSKGVLQGYTAVAAVDSKAQVIVAAQAHGSDSEQSALIPVIASAAPIRTDQTLVTADAGYHSEENLRRLHDENIPALRSGKFTPTDFQYDPRTNVCICPAGKRLYSTGSHCTTHGRVHHKFQGAKRECVPCDLRDRCLRHPQRTPTRQVAFFAKGQASPLVFTERMKAAIDSERGRRLYGRRIATVEPVFANLGHNKRLDRFTLRSRPKVNAQWQLYCLVHNIEKLAHHGYAQ